MNRLSYKLLYGPDKLGLSRVRISKDENIINILA